MTKNLNDVHNFPKTTLTINIHNSALVVTFRQSDNFNTYCSSSSRSRSSCSE